MCRFSPLEQDVLVGAEDTVGILPECTLTHAHVEERGVRAQLGHAPLKTVKNIAEKSVAGPD